MPPFFVKLLRTQNVHAEISRKEFTKLDLTTGIPRILYILRDSEGCVQRQLAQLCGIKESSLAVTLKRTEERGYIRRERILAPGNKSAYAIYLTETGRQKAEEVAVLMERLDRICLSGFSKEEIIAFYSMLDRVKKNLEGYQEDFLS